MVLAERKCLVVVKKIRVLGPQETLIHAAPEVRCASVTTALVESLCGGCAAWLCCAVTLCCADVADRCLCCAGCCARCAVLSVLT